jgi:hypothetical protein
MWQLPAHHSESDNENAEHNSDSSATFCSAFENDSGKGPDALTNQDKIHIIKGVSSLIETNRQQEKDDKVIIHNKNNNNFISVDDDKYSFPSSPVFHEISTDFSHLIDSILNTDDIHTTSLTTADTITNESICISKSNEHVALINFTTNDPLPDETTFSNVQVSPMEIQTDSATSKAASSAMSIDIFASLSPGIEHNGRDSKTIPDAFEQDQVINKNMPPPTEDEIVEIGKSFSRTLNIVSTDSTSESSPGIILSQKTLSTCKNNGKHKKKGKTLDKYEKVRLKSQFIIPDTTPSEKQNSESRTKELKGRKVFHAKALHSHARRKGQSKFPKGGKFHDGCQKKIIDQDHKSQADRHQKRIHGSIKQTGKARVNFINIQVDLKAEC